MDTQPRRLDGERCYDVAMYVKGTFSHWQRYFAEDRIAIRRDLARRGEMAGAGEIRYVPERSYAR